MQQRASLRVVLRDAGRYATVCYLSLTRKGDLYFGTSLAPFDPQVFRTSYHKDGTRFTRLPKGRQPERHETPPIELKGKVKLGASSGDSRMLRWDYTPKADSRKRHTLILESQDLPRSWTVDLWAIESRRKDLVGEILADYPPHGVVLAYVQADWCQPQFLAVIWTLSGKAWAALERSR